MIQISSLWNDFKSKFLNFVKRQNDYQDKRIILIQNFLVKELNQNHKTEDHQIQNLVFIRDAQLNIGNILCEQCFLQNKHKINYQYSLDIIKILEDVFFFIDQVLSCFQNELQFEEEKPYHQLRIFYLIKEAFDYKSLRKDNLWKINTCILEIESHLFFSTQYALNYFGKDHYEKINKAYINQYLQNIKITQQKINPYRQYIKLIPKIIYLKKFHPQSDYMYQHTISKNFIAILMSYQIIIYNIKTGIKFDIIKVDYENNNVQLFQFTKDENYLIFAYDKPYCQLVFDMKERISKIQNQQISFLECIQQNNQNCLLLYDQHLRIIKCFVLEQLTHQDFQISKLFSNELKFIQGFTFYDQIEKKWKNIMKNSYGSIIAKKVQITKKFKLQFSNGSRLNFLYYELISNSKKKIRRISSQEQNQKYSSYFLSQDERFIISSSLSFYEISTGNIAFEFRISETDEVQDVRVEEKKITVLSWDNLYIYDRIK